MSALLRPLLPPRHDSPDAFPHPQHPLVIQVRSAVATPADPGSLPVAELEAIGAGDIACEAVGGGLNVYAAHESAADEALRVLHGCPGGAAFECFGPDVRYRSSRPVREPVMSLTVEMPLIFGAFVRREVLRRRGCVHATDPAHRLVSLRGEAPLAALLGFGRWLDGLTDGRARLNTALLRWAPLGNGGAPDPGPLAA